MKNQQLIEKATICIGAAICGMDSYTKTTALFNFYKLIPNLKNLLNSATTRQKQMIYELLGRKMGFLPEALKEAVEALNLQSAVDKLNVHLKENIQKNIRERHFLEGDIGLFELAAKNALKEGE